MPAEPTSRPAVPRPVRREPPAPATTGERAASFPVLLALGAVLAVVFGVVGIVWGEQIVDPLRGDSSAEVADLAAAQDAASVATETIFSYRHDALEAHRAEATALMTSSYAETFDEIAPALDDAAPQREVIAEAVVRDAAPMACGDACAADKATILVFFDQGRTVDGQSDPDVFGKRIALDMQLVDGDWLVNDIRAL